MDQTNLPGPGDYATAAPTLNGNDPRNDDLTDHADAAHEAVVSRLAEGDAYCKVTARDIFAAIPSHHQLELLDRLFGLSTMTGAEFKEAADQLARDARQVVDDYFEGPGSWMVDSMAEEISEREDREMQEEHEAGYP